MDDKTRIKMLKTFLVLAGASNLMLFSVVVLQYQDMVKLVKNGEAANARLRTAGDLMKKIIEVTDPTPGQLVEINEWYDFNEWGSSLEQK